MASPHLEQMFQGLGDTLEIKDLERIFGVSYMTIRRWLAKGEMPGYQMPGGGWIILKAEVWDWLVERSNQNQ